MIVGKEASDVIYGGGHLVGRAGADRLVGGSGADRLIGGAGRDSQYQ